MGKEIMRIYIDYDDCLCETARYFSVLVKEMFGKDIPYENIKYFDLDLSFKLDDEQFNEMMIRAHEPEQLMSYEETPGASYTVNRWIDEGHEISIITGRPYSGYEASRTWLDRHGLERVKLYCLNKYGRDSFYTNRDFSLELDDYYNMKFDLAVEDSPKAFKYFDHLPELKVCVYDRPWNRENELPGDNYRRCRDWKEIDNVLRSLSFKV